NSISDINNDGYPDIISLDMLPENLESYKTSALEYSFPVYNSYLRNGYRPQYMQNTLHLNYGDLKFQEIGHLSGIAASEWSWSPLSVDLDNDGLRDLYISNGILGATNDMDFINFISNEEIQSKLGDKISEEHMQLIKKLPSKKVKNYVFKNLGNNQFEDMTDSWMNPNPSYSHGAAYTDLDNDGDLDLVVNNVNEPAYIIENKTDSLLPNNNYLKVSFQGNEKNRNGIGAMVKVFIHDKVITSENYTTKGFLSSIEPTINVGLGISKNIDSLIVIWPGGKYEVKRDITVNQSIVLDFKNASGDYIEHSEKSDLLTPIPGIDFVHDERTSIEFNRDPLIPFASTNEGPSISVGDVNNDRRDDFFISGAKSQASALFIQNPNGSFRKSQAELFEKSALNEDVSNDFADVERNGWLDIVVVSGGNEFQSGAALRPRIYLNFEGIFEEVPDPFGDLEVNASKVQTIDLNEDTFSDIIISADSKDLVFGKTPEQYIYLNDTRGGFDEVTSRVAPDFQKSGNVKDFVLADIDGDQDQDLIAVGLWMPISIFLNTNGTLKLYNSD
ncbi:MAG: VCBS repeat-containing protein, partial [Flavobacteriaceae bacterium]|nr:VCBS repeat-containing protein [Flavobacteriaceae bacterium]